MNKRIAEVKRKTRETDISIKINIDGSGKTEVKTGIGILDHMLELFAFHGLIDLFINAKGDFNVDIHHTNEDIGIVLGQAFKKALGDKKGIKRFGSSSVPMEEVVANVVIDISGRPTYTFIYDKSVSVAESQDGYALKDAEHFFEGFSKQLGMNMNIRVDPVSVDLHTCLEPVFKALGIAMDMATQIDSRRKGVPSTKGVID